MAGSARRFHPRLNEDMVLRLLSPWAAATLQRDRCAGQRATFDEQRGKGARSPGGHDSSSVGCGKKMGRSIAKMCFIVQVIKTIYKIQYIFVFSYLVAYTHIDISK